MLLEREAELGRVLAATRAALDGHGSVVALEAPAGQGKTALLRAVRVKAAGDGFRVLSATGAHLEQDFPFGIVRQLFEPVVHRTASTG